EALDDDRGGDVVRQVRDELRRGRVEVREVEPERVADLETDVRHGRQVRGEGWVDLDRMDECDPFREVAREYAEAGADLKHDIVRRQLRQTADHAEDVLVDQEVLAELLLRADIHRPLDGL